MVGMLLSAALFMQAATVPQTPSSDRDQLRQLLERVQQLEQQVRELQAQLRVQPAATSAPDPPVVPAATSPKAASPTPSSPEQPVLQAQQMPEMGSASDLPRIQFRGFSDVSLRGSGQPGDTTAFALGQFNLFITSAISSRLGVIAEPVLEADSNNAFGFELERLLLQMTANEYLNVSVGRYHTAIGWYNTAYHHSTWLQTAVDRPFLFQFEDKGGILPIHNVGVSATGRIPSGSFGLRYVAEVGNGRASRTPLDEPVQNVVDENNNKAINGGLFARPAGLPGFQAGFSVYHDRLTPENSSEISQTIFAAHTIYQQAPWEWLNELVLIRHAAVDSSTVMRTTGFYTQLARSFARWRPYFRYQYVNVPDDDPLYSDVGLKHGPSVGVRWDFSQFSAFKVQFDRTEQRHASGFNAFTTQFSFTF